MTKPNRFELPPGAHLVYYSEGGANVIYRIVWEHNTVPPMGIAASKQERMCRFPPLEGKLLRLRKETTSGIPYQEIARNFDQIIRPLFNPEEVVDQTLIQLPKGLVQQCNERLRAAEVSGTRPQRRHGVYLSVNEPFGLLVTDMTTFGDPGMSVMAELKPKWLLQSPSAPPNAKRCRTCALRDMKNHEAHKTRGSEDCSFCPLDLVSDRFENVLHATRFVNGCYDKARLARVLYRNSTLLKLQTHQKAMRDVGLYGQSAQSRDKSLAMTLRDCTMFIKMPQDDRDTVEIRLGDLDLKTGAGGKSEYWLNVENRLISQGWYMGTNSCQNASECALQGI